MKLLNIVCGSFANQPQLLSDNSISIGEGIYQQTETGAEMMERGMNLCKRFVDTASVLPDLVMNVHTNNHDAFNGIRLAVRRGIICHENVCFINVNAGGYIEYPTILQDGTFMAWPPGFFDALDGFLEEMIS